MQTKVYEEFINTQVPDVTKKPQTCKLKILVFLMSAITFNGTFRKFFENLGT